MAYGGGYPEGYGGPVVFITVEVAFDTDPGDDPVWTDLSDRLVSFNVNRGRQRGESRFAAGRARITLNNADRALDPTYTPSPYSPNVVPMRRCRIRAQHDATYDVFNGYVDDWAQQYAPPEGAVCVIQATDVFKVLANIELRSSAYAEEVDADSPSYWWRLGDPPGSTQAAESVDGVNVLTPNRTPTFGTQGLNAYDVDGAVQFTDTDIGLLGVFPAGTHPWGTAGSIEFIWRYDGLSVTDASIVNAAAIGTGLGPTGASAGVQTWLQTVTGDLQVVLSNNAGTIFGTLASTGIDIRTGGAHHFLITWAAGSPIKIYIDGIDRTAGAPVNFTGSMANTVNAWIVAVNAVTYPPFIIGGNASTIDELAIYPAQLAAGDAAVHAAALTTGWAGDTTGARIGRLLDAAAWSATDRDIDTGLSVLQAASIGGNVLTAMQKVEETEQGALFGSAGGAVRFIGRDSLLKAPYSTSQGTFGDSGSELEYGDLSYVYDDQLIVNDVQVTRDGGITQIVGDPTSQTRYLRRTKVFDGMLYSTDLEARDLANWYLTHYKDPQLRATNMRLEPTAGNEATHFPQVLGRELMDRVTVRRRPQNLGAAIDQDALIEGINHDVTAVEWRTTWNLSPAETQQYWILGVAGFSELGQTTRLAF